MRFDTSNIRCSAKMYSVVGMTATSGANELVQVGMVGKIGARIEDNVYEFLPLEATDTEVFVIATPEVDADESSVLNNSLKNYSCTLGEVVDCIQLGIKHDKFAIEKDGIENNSAIAKGGYVYATTAKRKLQFSATKPTTGAIMIAMVEDIVPATSGKFVIQGTSSNKALNQVQMNYDIVRCRIV